MDLSVLDDVRFSNESSYDELEEILTDATTLTTGNPEDKWVKDENSSELLDYLHEADRIEEITISDKRFMGLSDMYDAEVVYRINDDLTDEIYFRAVT